MSGRIPLPKEREKFVTWRDESFAEDFSSSDSEDDLTFSSSGSDVDLSEEFFEYENESTDDEDREAASVAASDYPVQIRKPRTSRKTDADRLHLAVWHNDPATVRYLVARQGVFVESFNAMGQTPLFVATYTRKLEVTSVLLNLGANPNVRCFGGYTAMHGACFSASIRILELLIKFGGDLSIHDVHRETPIDWVLEQQDEKRKIRLMEFIESVRRCTMKKPSQKNLIHSEPRQEVTQEQARANLPQKSFTSIPLRNDHPTAGNNRNNVYIKKQAAKPAGHAAERRKTSSNASSSLRYLIPKDGLASHLELNAASRQPAAARREPLRSARSFPHDLPSESMGDSSADEFYTALSGSQDVSGDKAAFKSTLSMVRELYRPRGHNGMARFGGGGARSVQMLHQQHAEARLFRQKYEERFGPLQRPPPPPPPASRHGSHRRLNIKPASHFTEKRSYGVGVSSMMFPIVQKAVKESESEEAFVTARSHVSSTAMHRSAFLATSTPKDAATSSARMRSAGAKVNRLNFDDLEDTTSQTEEDFRTLMMTSSPRRIAPPPPNDMSRYSEKVRSAIEAIEGKKMELKLSAAAAAPKRQIETGSDLEVEFHTLTSEELSEDGPPYATSASVNVDEAIGWSYGNRVQESGDAGGFDTLTGGDDDDSRTAKGFVTALDENENGLETTTGKSVWWRAADRTQQQQQQQQRSEDKRKASTASSGLATTDFYWDDELHPGLENDPNMQLVSADPTGNVAVEGSMLTDRDSVLSMEFPSTGPQSLRSEYGELDPAQEEEEDESENAATPVAE